MGKFNEIVKNMKQSFDGNNIEVNILPDKVIIDSEKKVVEVNNTLRAINVEINGVPSECFTSAEKEKLNKISTPMQVVGRVYSVELLPLTDVAIGSVYLVGQEGCADFEEYIVISSNPTTYESLGKTQTSQIQSDWNQTTSTESDYILNKPTKLSDFINDGEGGSPADSFVTESEITDVIETTIEVNGLTIGIQGTSADVVTKLLGSDWRLPTLAEYQELLECCTVGHTRQGGFEIPIVTSNTTHNILRFVYYNNNSHGSTRLTSNADSVDITKAATFYANAENWTASTATIDRYKKVAIRPVTDNPNLGADMGCPSGVRWASRDLGATTDGNTGNQYAFGEITTKAEYTWDTYLCAQAECGTTEDPLSHVTKPITSTVLHKDNTAAHLNQVKEARWDGKQDALGFIPENSANKKTSLAENSDTYYPTQKAVKTAVDAKVTGAASSTDNELAVYNGTTGKVLKSGSGVSAVGGNLTIGGTITANGVNISEAISTVKFRVNGGTFQVSIDEGLTWHTLTFVD